MGDFPYLEWLTRHYLEKAKKEGDWRTYIQAHGLANYCAEVDAREARWQLVYEVEQWWYQNKQKCFYENKHPFTFTQHQQLTKDHKELLEVYRKCTRLKFGDLKAVAKHLDWEKLCDKRNKTRIKSFTTEVIEESKACSEGLINVFKNIISSSVDILKQAGHDAPCKFAAIGLGSIPKGEATPYSDLEYAFLVQHGHEYFKYLAVDTYFRLGNLGESPLKTFDIEELKSEDKNKQLPLATEHLLKAGLRIDGITKNSGNIPTGNGKDNSQSLTLTVDAFMILYKMEAESPFEGFAGDKSDMLSSTVVIYTNEETTSQLYSDFARARRNYEQNKARVSKAVGEKRLESFKKDLETYTFLPEFAEFKPPANLEVKVKADVFRYPTLLANNVKMCLGLEIRYSWDVFDWLRSKKMLSAENHVHIQTVLALSIYMRTSAYLHQGCQTDVVLIHPYDVECTRKLYPVDLNLFIILAHPLIPLKRHIAGIRNAQSIPDDINSRVHVKYVIEEILRTLLINTSDSLITAEILYFAGRYTQAKTCVVDALGDLGNFGKVRIFLQEKHLDSQTAEKYIELCSYILYHTGDYSTAVEYLEHLVNHKNVNKKFRKLLVAVCKKKTGDYRPAKVLLAETKVMKKQEGEAADSETDHPDLADSYISIGSVYNDLGEYKSALEYHTKALKMRKAVYGTETDHPHIAMNYSNIGDAYNRLGENKSALKYHTKALEMKKAVYDTETDHPHIAMSYNDIGIAYYCLGEYKSAVEYHTEALKMRKAVYGTETDHPHIAMSYNNIANAYDRLGEYKSAREYHTEALKMRKAVYGIETDHPDVAISYNNIGDAYNGLGEYKLALEYYNNSLVMKNAIYGTETDHPSVAISYNNIGDAYNGLGEYKSALEYHTKALEVKKAVYGTETDHPSVAMSYNNIGEVYNGVDEYSSAMEYLTDSLRMRQTIYGTETYHPEIAESYNNIGNAYEGLGEHKPALEYHTKALKMRKAVYGDKMNHPHIAESHHVIGRLYHTCGDYELARSHLTKAAVMYLNIFGADHPKVAQIDELLRSSVD